MSLERATGIVLRTRLLTETSLIVHWLTAEQGRLATVAKGALRPKSPLRGKLDLFYVAEFTFQRSRRSTLHTLREVALRDTQPVIAQCPQALRLIGTYSHLSDIHETPPQLSHLRDSMILVDNKHALIRFEKDLPRSKLLIDEVDQVRPYVARFIEIWREGGEPVSGNPLGL